MTPAGAVPLPVPLLVSLVSLLAASTARAQSPADVDAPADPTAHTPAAAPAPAAARAAAPAPAPAPARAAAPASAQASTAAPGASAAPGPAQVQQALARYAHEPSVEALVRAALQHMPRTDTEALASRARTAGWVPSVRLGARRGQGVDLSSSVDNAVRLSTDADLTLSAVLSFDLDRVVFRREEVALAGADRAERHARDERVRQIVHLYFLRRRLQLERDLGVGDPLAHAVEIARIEATLDVFTAGVFERMMKASRQAHGKPSRAHASLRRGDRGDRDRR